MSMLQTIHPEGFPTPRGYAHGIVGRGRILFVGGQVGWTQAHVFVDDFVAQFAQALDNVLAIVGSAGGAPEDIARMTVYVTNLDAYRNSLKALGGVWKERLGKHYPAMALVGVSGLVEKQALVEIEATAILR